MEVLNVKVDRETKEKLERLVKRRVYQNKSEAVRRMLEEHLREHAGLFASEEIEGLVKEADKMTEREFERIAGEVFSGRKMAAEMVAEGRGASIPARSYRNGATERARSFRVHSTRATSRLRRVSRDHASAVRSG